MFSLETDWKYNFSYCYLFTPACANQTEHDAGMALGDWGWNVDDQQVTPVMTSKPPAPAALLQIVRCNCQTDCNSRAVAMAWNVRQLAGSARAQVVPTREPCLKRTLMMLLNELCIRHLSC